MSCFCFCPNRLDNILLQQQLPLLSQRLSRAGRALHTLPSNSTSLNIAAGANLKTGFNLQAPGVPLNALRRIPLDLLRLALAPLNLRATLAATAALNLTGALDLPTAHARLKMSAHTATRFVVPHLDGLAAIPTHLLAKIALAAQLIDSLLSQGLSPYNSSHLRRFGSRNSVHSSYRTHAKLSAHANIKIASSLFGGANPLLALLALAQRLGLDIHSAADLRLAGNLLASFAGAALKLNTNLNTAFGITTALNAVSLLQSTFDELLYSAAVQPWERVTKKLSQFANASRTSRRSQGDGSLKTRGHSRYNAKAAVSASMNAWLGIPIPPELLDWLLNAKAPVVRAAAHAAIRLGLAIKPGFANIEAAIGLVLALSAALDFRLNGSCCGICDSLKNSVLPPALPMNLGSAIPQLPIPNVKLPF